MRQHHVIKYIGKSPHEEKCGVNTSKKATKSAFPILQQGSHHDGKNLSQPSLAHNK
jgi:hypothetical protein